MQTNRGLEPAIYVGTAMHRRHDRFARVFTPKLYMIFLPLDAADTVINKLHVCNPFWLKIFRFREDDYFVARSSSLADAVRTKLSHDLNRPVNGPVFVLTQVRTFGWLFNPLTIYYAYNSIDGSLDGILLEVTNTPWHERRFYTIDAHAPEDVPKQLYVSPFQPMDLQYHFSWDTPGETVRFRVEARRASQSQFVAHLQLRRQSFCAHNLWKCLFRYPFMTLRTSLGIYAQAVLLILKRVPIHRHTKRPSS